MPSKSLISRIINYSFKYSVFCIFLWFLIIVVPILGYYITSKNSISDEMLSFIWIFFGTFELIGICVGIGFSIEEEDREEKKEKRNE